MTPTSFEQTLLNIRQNPFPALMTHLVLGYPSPESNLSTIEAMSAAGADLIELQIPFSDPVADGPTMMRASQAALDAGMTVEKALQFVHVASQRVKTPLLVMTYFNIVFRYGVEAFCRAVATAGAVGLIVPDLPPEEEDQEGFAHACQQCGLANIGFVSPVTPTKRMALLDTKARGFLYCFATSGITGARAQLDPRLKEYLLTVRGQTTLPLAVGFGLTTRDHVEAIAPYADIAIVGSAMLDRLDAVAEGDRPATAAAFIRELKG